MFVLEPQLARLVLKVDLTPAAAVVLPLVIVACLREWWALALPIVVGRSTSDGLADAGEPPTPTPDAGGPPSPDSTTDPEP